MENSCGLRPSTLEFTYESILKPIWKYAAVVCQTSQGECAEGISGTPLDKIGRIYHFEKTFRMSILAMGKSDT